MGYKADYAQILLMKKYLILRIYESALMEEGHKVDLKFANQLNPRNNNNKRRRNVIWFNPLFNIQERTNIGKMFFTLLRKHFLKGSALKKLFNRNTIKNDYSSIGNVNNIIKGLNGRNYTESE